MRQARHHAHEYTDLREFIGRLWILDLMYIFDVKSPTELQRVLEGVRIRMTDYGYEVLPLSGIYVKYHSGKVFPEIDTVNWLVKVRCAEAARALDLCLWSVLSMKWPISSETLDGNLASLSAEVREVIFQPVLGSRYMVERRPIDVDSLVRELADIGTVDAFTAIVALLEDRKQLVESDEYFSVLGDISSSAEILLFRLLIFHPFYGLRKELYDYFNSHVFVNYTGVDEEGFVVREEEYPDTSIQTIEYLHCLLNQMIQLGLVGPTFKEQLDFVRSPLLYQYHKAISAAFMKQRPFVLAPPDPLWEFLTKTGHPAVRSGQPISLPLHSEDRTYRVANALGDAFVKSRGRDKPFGHPGGVVRRVGQRRSGGQSRRSRRSEGVGGSINSDQRMQAAETGKDDQRNR